jgi:hypothetical protein
VTTLYELQKKFQDYVLSPKPGMDSEVIGTQNAGAATRLEIYSDAYCLRLIEALAGDYPAVKALAGEEQFDRLARAYIRAHPSVHYNVRWFGQSFAALLRGEAEPHLGEMAEFEWAMTLAFDAADEPALTLQDMAQVPPEAWPEMTFVPHPSLQRLKLTFNIPEIWKAVDKNEELPPVKEAPAAWIVWRRDYKTYFRSLGKGESYAVDAMCARAAFSDICGGVTKWVDEENAALHAAGLLKGWVTEGILRAVAA